MFDKLAMRFPFQFIRFFVFGINYKVNYKLLNFSNE